MYSQCQDIRLSDIYQNAEGLPLFPDGFLLHEPSFLLVPQIQKEGNRRLNRGTPQGAIKLKAREENASAKSLLLKLRQITSICLYSPLLHQRQTESLIAKRNIRQGYYNRISLSRDQEQAYNTMDEKLFCIYTRLHFF